MKPKEFLEKRGLNPEQPIHWLGEDEYLTLEYILQEYEVELIKILEDFDY